MRVDDDVASILLATSPDVIELKKRGFKMRVDDVANNISRALPAAPRSCPPGSCPASRAPRSPCNPARTRWWPGRTGK